MQYYLQLPTARPFERLAYEWALVGMWCDCGLFLSTFVRVFCFFGVSSPYPSLESLFKDYSATNLSMTQPQQT